MKTPDIKVDFIKILQLYGILTQDFNFYFPRVLYLIPQQVLLVLL